MSQKNAIEAVVKLVGVLAAGIGTVLFACKATGKNIEVAYNKGSGGGIRVTDAEQRSKTRRGRRSSNSITKLE